ncbi:MAG: hypothetical protein ACRC6E_02465, partial [Fusobacteriaceae bacterium]
MNFFKAKKYVQGVYTMFITKKGEPKMRGKELVFENIKAGEDEFGDAYYTSVQVMNAYDMINISRNYSDEEMPKTWQDKETYGFFPSSRVDEGDWVCKNKETKEKLGELFFDADAGVLMGWLGTKNNEVIFDVSDSE